MLVQLEIKNYAIIQYLDIRLENGLNIITGETGAGKSILIGALGLALGNRADTKVLYNDKDKCVIEALFDISQYNLNPFFEEQDLDYATKTSLRREISASGKSRAFVNDTPVTLEVLRTLAEKLVNLTSQNETQQLNKENYQLDILDAVANNESLLKQYKESYKTYKKTESNLITLKEEQIQLQKDYDYHQFQFDEIENAALEEDDIQDLEQELDSLNNAENIQTSLYNVVKVLDNDDVTAIQLLNEAFSQINEIRKYDDSYEKLSERLNSVILELEDLKEEAMSIANKTELDEERIEILTTKLNDANKLLRKHHVESIEELLKLKSEFEEKLLSFSSNNQVITRLEKELQNQEKELQKQAKQLSESRQKAANLAKSEIENTMHQVGMPNAVFEIELQDKKQFSPSGSDEVCFLFNANKGFKPQALNKIASGGELSRVMLSIQALLAKKTALPTLIFDEIDTGISGETAAKVAEVFTQISKKHQLIAITHLPQIAAKAERHFYIYKEEHEAKTTTKIAVLNEEKHVKAIARMLSGETISEESVNNAKRLIQS